jgi:hypothetical protein
MSELKNKEIGKDLLINLKNLFLETLSSFLIVVGLLFVFKFIGAKYCWSCLMDFIGKLI